MTTRFAFLTALTLAVPLLASFPANAQAPRPGQTQAAKPSTQPGPQVPPNPDTPDPARLQAFSGTPLYQGLIKRALDNVPPATFQRCPSLVSNGSQLTILQPIRYADDFPVAGVWRHSFPVSGCGYDTRLNFYFIATPEKRINIVIGLPGSTRGDPTLQHDAQAYAFKGVSKALSDQGVAPCDSFAVKNTSFEAYGLQNPPTPDPGPAELRRPWWESWTVAGCDRTFLVPLDFIPHAGVTEVVQPGHVAEQASPTPPAPPPTKP